MKKTLALALALAALPAFAAKRKPAADENSSGSTASVSIGTDKFQRHEISGGATGIIALATGGGSTAFTAGVAFGYAYRLLEDLQLEAKPSISLRTGSGNTTFSLAFTAGPTLNFPFGSDIRNAFFAYVGPGIDLSTGGGSTSTTFLIEAQLGKRFLLGDNVTYKPNFDFKGYIASTSVFVFAIYPLNFSLVF